MSEKTYKWYFSHKNYGQIELIAHNYKEFWNILENTHNVDLHKMKNETIFVAVRNIDGSSLPKDELEKVFVLH